MIRLRRARLFGMLGIITLTTAMTSTAMAAGQSSTITVNATVINGTRTLNLTDPTGSSLAGGLALGAGHGGAFLVNVTDVNYVHVGYQVTATMSNLYPYTTSYQFGQTPIPSSAVSMAYPGNLLDIANLGTLVTPIVHLADSVAPFATTPLSATIDGTTQSVQTLQTTVTQATLTSVANELPVKLQQGDTGPFTSPAAVTGQSGTFTPTQLNVLSGTAQSLAALLTDLTNALNGPGHTAQQLVTSGVIDQNSVVAAAAAALGLTPDQLAPATVTSILNNTTATVTGFLPATGSADNILGQSGSYNAMPQLSLTLPSQQPAGTYRGELTFTLMDH